MVANSNLARQMLRLLITAPYLATTQLFDTRMIYMGLGHRYSDIWISCILGLFWSLDIDIGRAICQDFGSLIWIIPAILD